MRLKEIRQKRGQTQTELASMLKTTQQTIARWESGKAEPSISALRDLAVIYGTSVDDLLGNNPIATSVVSNLFCGVDDGDEHFWGHLGILLPGDKMTRWYPLTQAEADRVATKLRNVSREEPWFAVMTLNNRTLVLNGTAVKRIYLLDDNADEVFDDWELGWDSYQGESMEVYRLLANWYDVDSGEQVECSDTLREGVTDLIKEHGLSVDVVQEHVKDTIVQFRDRTTERHNMEFEVERLWEIVSELGIVQPVIFDLTQSDRGLEVYIPAEEVLMIDAPLYQVIDGAKAEERECQREIAAAES